MTDTQRAAALRQMLTHRHDALQADLRMGLRDGRDSHPDAGRDSTDQADDDIRGDLRFALLQMKSETIAHLEAALERLDAGEYGHCTACGREVPQARLSALPFAVQCQPCAARREQATVGALGTHQ